MASTEKSLIVHKHDWVKLGSYKKYPGDVVDIEACSICKVKREIVTGKDKTK